MKLQINCPTMVCLRIFFWLNKMLHFMLPSSRLSTISHKRPPFAIFSLRTLRALAGVWTESNLKWILWGLAGCPALLCIFPTRLSAHLNVGQTFAAPFPTGTCTRGWENGGKSGSGKAERYLVRTPLHTD